MKTFTGRYVDPFDLKTSDIDIVDISHHLSMICRFNGASRFHYSVAQHSVLAHDTVAHHNKLAALLHDASEAYLCDIPRPIKHSPQFQWYRDLECDVMAVILAKFGLQMPLPKEVKDVDNSLVVAEGIELMNERYQGYGPPAQVDIREWTQAKAEAEFLARFRDIARRGVL